ncbi:MAG: hypothetical protein JW834_01075 [Candidatus Diapherotrites archaeon]|nr:hypothetical protein [Candidatus Diapherotrites archaeon]
MGKRLSTGIRSLDKLLSGGYPEGSVIEICGDSGTGKTTLGLQFLSQGSEKKEKGVYISFEQSAADVQATAKTFNMDMKNVEVIQLAPDNFEDTIERISSLLNRSKATRAVIDSATTLSLYVTKPEWMTRGALRTPKLTRTLYVPGEGDERRALYSLTSLIKQSGVTTLLISERREGGSRTAEETLRFLVDGIVTLRSMVLGEALNRALEVNKMRFTPVKTGSLSIDFGKNGITIVK